MTGRPAAVLFDLDGTLIDTAPAIAHAANLALTEQGMTPQPQATVRGWIGGGVEVLLRRALRAMGGAADDPAMLGALIQRFRVHYRDCLVQGVAPYPGIPGLLQTLATDGVPLGLVTNKPREFTLPLLGSLGLLPAFGGVFCGDDLPQRKPDPQPLLAAAAALDVDIGSTWMVGDSLTDMLAACRAGSTAVLVGYGYGSLDPHAREQAQIHARDVRQLRELLYPR